MSPPGATSAPDPNAERRQPGDSADSFFLPNFCDARMVLGVVLMSELLALIFALVRPPAADFLTNLGRISILMLWLGLTSAGLLCVLRNAVSKLSTAMTTGVVIAIVLANIFVLSSVIVFAGFWLGGGEPLNFFPDAYVPFLIRNLLIGLIVTALLLRYFFVSHQWRQTVQAEARSRIDALQARIRPHFLFNSMNTIASLTRSDPGRAEEAVEDLADLFRATLSDAGRLLSLSEELELTRIYQRIEQLRLGERLHVVWNVDALPMHALIPGLTIQPLLENAIYHGIEPLDGGGTVTVTGASHDGEIEITIANPLGPDGDRHTGQRMALNNIRERLRLAYEGRGSLEIDAGADSYRVTVRIPQVQ